MPAAPAPAGSSHLQIALHWRVIARIAQVAIHVAGAPYHRLVARDGTLARSRRAGG